VGFIECKTPALIFKSFFHDGKKQKTECPLWHAFYFTKWEERAFNFSKYTPLPSPPPSPNIEWRKQMS
jgi:hypothetical protein